MSGACEVMTACCCAPFPPGSCPCASGLSSIVVNWTGSVTLAPMTCLDYWGTYITATNTGANTDCGWQCSLSSVGTIVYTMPSTVVTLLPATCGGESCYEKTVSFERFVIPFIPFGGYATAAEYCQNEIKDVLYFSSYRNKVGYGVSVSMPTPSNPKWRITIAAGGVSFRFISTDADFSCTPTTFVLDPLILQPEQNSACHGHFGTNVCNTGEWIDYPPTLTYCNYFGVNTRHRVTFNAGSLSIS